MENIKLIHIICMLIGLVVYWLPKISTIKMKLQKEFSLKYFWNDQAYDVLYTMIAACALLIIVPEALTYFNALWLWSPGLAIGCGASNIYLMRLFVLVFEMIWRNIAKKYLKDEKKEAE